MLYSVHVPSVHIHTLLLFVEEERNVDDDMWLRNIHEVFAQFQTNLIFELCGNRRTNTFQLPSFDEHYSNSIDSYLDDAVMQLNLVQELILSHFHIAVWQRTIFRLNHQSKACTQFGVTNWIFVLTWHSSPIGPNRQWSETQSIFVSILSRTIVAIALRHDTPDTRTIGFLSIDFVIRLSLVPVPTTHR